MDWIEVSVEVDGEAAEAVADLLAVWASGRRDRAGRFDRSLAG